MSYEYNDEGYDYEEYNSTECGDCGEENCCCAGGWNDNENGGEENYSVLASYQSELSDDDMDYDSSDDEEQGTINNMPDEMDED